MARKLQVYLFSSPPATHSKYDLGSPSLSNMYVAQFGVTLRLLTH
ncbi:MULTISPECIES: hypothetical protein [Rossellomorea]|nr:MULTISPECIES: hypothetical protein [Rossellomorea]MDT9027449.1 hypothetical protein [Rossellomorea sp. YC4-1]